MPKSSSKSCNLCGEPAKYSCPACSCNACSLNCSTRHKELYSCSGIRDKTKFVPKSLYGEQEFISDFHLLDDIGKAIDDMARKNKQSMYQKSQKLIKQGKN